MRRLNKEYKLDVCDSILLKYGTVNRDDPQVVYVSGRCWVSPTKKMDYVAAIDYISSSFKKHVKHFMIDGVNFSDRLILDFDLNGDNMLVGGKKFLSFDFYLRQCGKNKRKLKELKGMLSSKVGMVAESLLNDFKECDFSVNKRK